MQRNDSGAILLEAIIGFAILGLFAGMVLQQLQIAVERTGQGSKRAMILAESANIIERVGFDISLDGETGQGPFETVENATWRLDIEPFSDGRQSPPVKATGNLKQIRLTATWPRGTAVRSLAFVTLRRVPQ